MKNDFEKKSKIPYFISSRMSFIYANFKDLGM